MNILILEGFHEHIKLACANTVLVVREALGFIKDANTAVGGLDDLIPCEIEVG
jgi:hypothetical protein